VPKKEHLNGQKINTFSNLLEFSKMQIKLKMVYLPQGLIENYMEKRELHMMT
jgi:hypothetical protein